MNSPPDALSPSPSTPSSGSPPPDDAAAPAAPAAAASPPQTKRRLPPSAASVFAGRENKTRKRDSGGRGGVWDAVRAAGSERAREELVDLHMVEYVRTVYGDPFDDTLFEQRNKLLS